MKPSISSTDRLGRPLRDLRISLTDRCNLRCRYCMPRELFGRDHAFLPEDRLLDFSEILEIARAAHNLGVRKIRLTGGEPLLRAGICDLIGALREMSDIDLAMTTNGVLLARLAQSLADAGLSRVTVSLDSLNQDTFAAMSDSRSGVSQVLGGIAAAEEVGLPVKVNTVLKRGVNDSEIVPLAEHFRHTSTTVRFIEFMDVGSTNGWEESQVVSSAEVVDIIGRRYPADPVEPSYPGEVASRYAYRDGAGQFGVISSVTEPFCGACSRIRISADGQLYTCLFADSGLDLRTILRSTRSAGDIEAALSGRWRSRSDRYSELRRKLAPSAREKIEMSYIGG